MLSKSIFFTGFLYLIITTLLVTGADDIPAKAVSSLQRRAEGRCKVVGLKQHLVGNYDCPDHQHYCTTGPCCPDNAHCCPESGTYCCSDSAACCKTEFPNCCDPKNDYCCSAGFSCTDSNETPCVSKCGGNCPSGKCPDCYCGTTRNQLSDAAITAQCNMMNSVPGWDATCCLCIAKAESSGNANAVLHNNDGSTDVGLWQINSRNWGQGICSGNPPCSVSENLDCAKQVFLWGSKTWRFWYTCKPHCSSVCNCG